MKKPYHWFVAGLSFTVVACAHQGRPPDAGGGDAGIVAVLDAGSAKDAGAMRAVDAGAGEMEVADAGSIGADAGAAIVDAGASLAPATVLDAGAKPTMDAGAAPVKKK